MLWDLNGKPRAQLLLEEGEEEKAREVAERLHQRGYSLADIAELVGYDIENVQLWLGLTSA